MTKNNFKRPRDPNQLAKLIADVATGHFFRDDVEEMTSQAKLGQLGGEIGGKARAASLSPERGREIAKRAERSRWRGDE